MFNRTHKFKIPISYDIPRQSEVIKIVKLTDSQMRAIAQDFFNKMDYEQRQQWIRKNLR